MKKRRHFFLSLVETLVVIILMATLSTTIGISVYKYLETGKAFTTIHNSQQVKNALEFQLDQDQPLIFSSQSGSYKEVENWKVLIRHSPFISKSNLTFKDGWKQPFKVFFNEETREFKIESESLKKYEKKYGSLVQNQEDEVTL